jgi:serine/threonine protein phosphatase PrpC
LDPLTNNLFIFSAKSKAGSTGKQIKVNQDIAFASQKLAEGVKAFVVCDGHGLNGHLVSAFIKSRLLSTF